MGYSLIYGQFYDKYMPHPAPKAEAPKGKASSLRFAPDQNKQTLTRFCYGTAPETKLEPAKSVELQSIAVDSEATLMG